MKRVLVMVIVVLSVLSINVLAAGDIEVVGGVSFANLEFSFHDKQTIQNHEDNNTDSIKDLAGNELYGGIRYVLENGLGFGAGYNSLSCEYTIEEFQEYFNPYGKGSNKDKKTRYFDVDGPYVEVLYKVTEMITIRGAVLFQNIMLSYEYSEENYYEDFDTGDITQNKTYEKFDYAKGEGLGYQLGAEINYPLSEDFFITGKAAYILGSQDITHTYDSDEEELTILPDNRKMTVEHSGFSLGFGINYSF